MRASSEMSTNSTYSRHDEDIVLYIGLSISSLGLLLNILTVLAISRIKKNDITRRQHTYFLLNIMICDMVITFAGILFSSLKHYQLHNVGYDSEGLDGEKFQIRQNLQCAQKMALRLFDVGSNANLIGLSLMSVDHFIVVRFSLKHRILMRKRVVFSLIGSSWLLSALLGMLGLLLIVSEKKVLMEASIVNGLNEKDFCVLEVLYLYKHPETGEYYVQLGQQLHFAVQRWISIFLITTTFTVMTLVHCYIAFVVIRVSKEQQRRLRNSSVSPAERDSRMRQSQVKGLCTTILLLGTFTLVWLPLQIVYYLEGSRVLESADEIEKIERILFVIATTTGILDVVIYFLRSRELTAVMELRNRCLKTSADSPKSSTHFTSSRNTAQQTII